MYNFTENQLVSKELEELKTAVLVSIYPSGGDKKQCEEYLDELERLASTFGLEAVRKVPCPIKKFDAATVLKEGKLEELKKMMEDTGADLIIFDDEIAPHQQRNLEEFFKKPVIDRTELIVEVFAKSAQTKEARLQVELAKVKYQFPRLRRLWTHLSRQSGSGGSGAHVKGEGEKQIELDRRMLKSRIETLNKEIEKVRAQRETQRKSRRKSAIPCFSIVGYTNAGKSTLLRALTKADVLVEDKLFATLDTTARKFMLPNGKQIVLVDTVGFIRKIPHTLVTAFRSTLEEAIFADFLIHLIDASSPSAESQAEETLKVLKELGAADIPIITVLNKIDACTDKERLAKLKLSYPKCVLISATNGDGVRELLELMVEETGGNKNDQEYEYY